MEIELGVACGRCDRYNVLGSGVCSCGQALAIGLPLPSAKAAVKSAAEAPPPSLFENDVLKPRRVPGVAAAGPPRPGATSGAAIAPAVPRPGTTTAAVRAQAMESALSSSSAAIEQVSRTGHAAGGELSEEERMVQ